MKKLLPILLAMLLIAALTLSFASCDGSKPNDDETPGDKNNQIVDDPNTPIYKRMSILTSVDVDNAVFTDAGYNAKGKENGNTDNETVAAAHAILSASTAEDIDLSAFTDLPTKLLSAKKTASGNYIFETKGAGYGIKGGDDYHPASGKYIEIRICLTPEGKILDVITTFQEESKGIGDACANEKFYGQFDGKTEGNYKEIDAIGGATMTTNGYLEAIEVAFASMKILEGGAN